MIKVSKTPNTEIRYTLEISGAQMQFLADVMGSIGGSAQNTRRGIAEEFRRALTGEGFYSDHSTPDKTGYITFKSLTREIL